MSEKKNTYKDTLNLPRTDFDMRAGLLAKEPAIQARWLADDLYGQIRRARAGAPRFVLHDGPPYANGNIHIGHAMNKSLKDFVWRYKTMTGMDAPVIHGWDCHGLPIESRVQKDLGPALAKMNPIDIRRLCMECAARYVKIQTQQFQRLGVLGDFNNIYITMAGQYEAAVLEVLARLVEQGLVYKQLKPVHWSLENRTALAEAELEYEDRKDPSIFVLYEVVSQDALRRLFKFTQTDTASLMIWTTTPWTLPANLAVAAHPDYEYVAVQFTHNGAARIAVLAAQLAQKVLATGGVTEYTVLGKATGTALRQAGITYKHPLVPGKTCPVVNDTYVTLEDGTGLVHNAPGHGLEDYGTALKYGLEIYCPVQADGTFDSTAPAWLVGKTVWQANPLVLDFLRQAGTLFHFVEITHSYPHDWRSKGPTIFRATEQWFIGVDRPMKRGTTLREMAMDACRRPAAEGGMDFVPGWGRNRLAGMLESRPDWCISRQRAWGLPIPAFYNQKDQPLLTAASVRAVAKHFAGAGSDSWFTQTAKDLLDGYDPHRDPELTNPDDFTIDKLRQGFDILDVWFESGSSWYAVGIGRDLVKENPVDLYLEGSDQHRGWFQLSLLPALGATGQPPTRSIVTHGWVMDENGRKMSKSEGNTIDVIEQLSKRGADILRLWVSSQNYHEDVRGSEGLIAQSEDAYRKIRNTLRYCMGSCANFNPATDAVEPAEHSLDRWMRLELHRLIRDVRAAYEAYEFHRVHRLLYEFCTVQASSIYMAAIKDRLYCDSLDSPRCRATQTVLHEMLMAMVKLLAPILPHTCEEAWGHIPNRPASEPASVHLAMMPEVDDHVLAAAESLSAGWCQCMAFETATMTPSPAMVWNRLLELRQEGQARLEQVRAGGLKNPLDAEAVFQVARDNASGKAFLKLYLAELEDLLGVGYARVEEVDAVAVEGAAAPAEPGRTSTAAGVGAIGVRIEDGREKYKACARSWKRRPDVGSDPEYPDLSARDAAVMRKLGRKS